MSDLKNTLTTLNAEFAIEGQLKFKINAHDQITLCIDTSHAQAEIVLQGAHLIHWQPRDQQAVIWLSEDAVFAAGKSLRGGVPVCWPWFGAHADNEKFPAHGYARTEQWQVTAVKQLASEDIQIDFKLIESERTKTLWPHQSELELRYTIGASLDIQLLTQNTGTEAFVISEALHTYFNVKDVSQLKVTGLHGIEYLDKPDNFLRKVQQGDIDIKQEVDRVYLNTADDVCIDDPLYQRRIKITKTNSLSTVVWNPWQEVAAKMGDLGEAGYKNMICIESANAADNEITLLPGERHALKVSYSIEALS